MITAGSLVKTKIMPCNSCGERHDDIAGAPGKLCRFISPRFDSDRRLLLQFRGSAITSDVELLPTASWMTRWSDRHRGRYAGRGHAPASTVGTGWVVCCGNRCLGG
jgi:hypothetical protein